MKKNMILIMLAIMVCLMTAPQIFGLETAPAAVVETKVMDFDTLMTNLPERVISDCDMAELEVEYNAFVAAEEAGQQAEANKQLDDFCFKLSTFPYAE
jgi:hypothetical protein